MKAKGNTIEQNVSPDTAPLYTLVICDQQVELPQNKRRGRPTTLEQLAGPFGNGTYVKLISYIRQGAFLRVACEACGIPVNTVYQWLTRGRDDSGFDNLDYQLKPKEDTLYARFFLDVRRAVAECRANAEMQVFISSPEKWLAKGMGHVLGTEWGEAPGQPALEGPAHQDAMSQAVAPSLPAPKQIEVEEDVAELTVDDYDVFSELHEAGIVQLNPSFRRAIKEQKHGRDQIDPEPLEADDAPAERERPEPPAG